MLNPLRALKLTIRSRHLEHMYLSFILPHLEYGCIVFDSTSQNLLTRLYQIHYRAAIIISGCTHGTSAQKVIRSLDWMTLGARRREKRMVLMYDIQHNSVPSYVHDIFTDYRNPVVDVRLRTQQPFLLPPRMSARLRRSTVPSTIIRDWDSVPARIKDCYSRNSFKYNIFKREKRLPYQYKTRP
jgi:hypothetical protein